ncbi:MAG: hypothetical protein JNK89_08920, partial [Saprospiraceae bacterium]|nr:hypothetical protein [Saprospiraceae bacterium]
YSWDDLYHNFTIGFGALNLAKRSVSDVLLLGLGLGSVPFILEKIYGKQYRYTAVEWDEQVAQLASKYTFSRLSSPIELVTADANLFVQQTRDCFDLLVIDIFEDDYTPLEFETPEFLEACASRLRPGGLLLYNRLYNTPANIRGTVRFYEDCFRSVFPDAWKIDTGGNWILAAERN